MATDFHSLGIRPAQRTRTPRSSRVSRDLRMKSRLKFIRNRTSSGERFQFSVEKAYREMFPTPISIAPWSTSMTCSAPTLCPSVRGSPRSLAQRPLPSMTIATCSGTRSPSFGGRAPDGCGSGVLYSRRCRPRIPRTAISVLSYFSTYRRERSPRSRCQCR
ncbi:hypothetical protein RKD37_006107 [Streptomyces ambofaciens]